MPAVTDVRPDPPAPPAGNRRRDRLARLRWVLVGALVVLVVTGAGVAALARSGANDVPKVRRFDPPRPAPSLSVPLRPVSYWENAFLAHWDDDYRQALPLSTSGDSWDMYELSYDVDADTAMFRATGNTRYLDRALTYVDNVVATARRSSSLKHSQYHDSYLGWVSLRNGTNGTEVPLYESYFWRYATTMLRVMRQTPAVYADPHYRAQYDRLLSFAEVDVFRKWYGRDRDNVYASTTHTASHWALIALNLSVTSPDAKRRAMYRSVMDNVDLHLPNVDASLRGQMVRSPVDGSAYFWDADWGSYRRPGQDVSHGNGVIAYVVEAADQGGNWSRADMDRFLAVLTGVIRPHGGTFPAYVDGSGQDNGWISDGFVKLARYSPAAQHQLETYPVANNQFIANMALNARILLS